MKFVHKIIFLFAFSQKDSYVLHIQQTILGICVHSSTVTVLRVLFFTAYAKANRSIYVRLLTIANTNISFLYSVAYVFFFNNNQLRKRCLPHSNNDITLSASARFHCEKSLPHHRIKSRLTHVENKQN